MVIFFLFCFLLDHLSQNNRLIRIWSLRSRLKRMYAARDLKLQKWEKRTMSRRFTVKWVQRTHKNTFGTIAAPPNVDPCRSFYMRWTSALNSRPINTIWTRAKQWENSWQYICPSECGLCTNSAIVTMGGQCFWRCRPHLCTRPLEFGRRIENGLLSNSIFRK